MLEALRETLALYARTFRRGAELALRNAGVGLLVVGYQTLLGLGGMVAAPLGIVGGILLYLLTVACLSSWLALVEQVIRSGRVRLADVPSSFAAYLNDLLTVAFLLWILSTVAALVLQPLSLLHIVFMLATFVFFNAVPELIYLGRHSATALLAESYRFIGENWLEWFPANLFLLACFVVTLRVVPQGPFGVLAAAASGVVLYFAMIVRGLLFMELDSSTRRSREFRRRAAS